MSIIFGYINLTNKPVERATLETMKRAMDFWGPDGEGLWVEDTCGLGNLLYYNTPEALFEKLPISDLSGQLVMTAGARIDNRDELFRVFDIPLGQRLTMPDSALMLKAYEKWGEACADHLVGDWAFAIWDRRERKLFLARDHHGITALYYYKGEDFFVFSSSLKGILCLPQVPKKVNEYKIAQLLVNWNEGGPTTCYLDIMRLPPAHTLTLHSHHTHTSSTLTPTRYWYLEHTPEVHLANDQEYADMFLELYTEAVRCRLRSHRPVGATLSSGLDSGSVCILAAKELAKQGKRLQAYTAVPLYDVPAPPNRIGDEGPLAKALAEKLGNVDVTLCRAGDVSPLKGVECNMQVHSQPNFVPWNAYWIVDIFKRCENNHLGSLLIGQNGNGTISWPTRSLLNNNQYSFAKTIHRYKQKLKYITGIWGNDFIIADSLFKKVYYKEINRRTNFPPYFNRRLSAFESRLRMLSPGETSLGCLWDETGTFFKTEVRDPTIDLMLMKFLFGIPVDSPLNSSRRMFEESFIGYFPESIVNGKVRGIQANDLSVRLAREMDNLRVALLFSDKNEGKIFNYFVSNPKLERTFLNKKHNDINKLLMGYTIKMFVEL